MPELSTTPTTPLDVDPGDEQLDLILDAEAYGLYSGGWDDSPEGWWAQ